MNAILAPMARLLVVAALILPPLLFHPRSEHAFWAFESASGRVFAVLAFIFASLSGYSAHDLRQTLRHGLFLCSAFFAWSLLAVLASTRPDLGSLALSQWSCYSMIFLAVWNTSPDLKGRDRVLASALFAGFLLAVFGLVQAAGFQPWKLDTGFEGRASSFLGNPNFLGGHLALLAPACLGRALAAGKKTAKLALGLLFILLVLCLLATGTRGATLGLTGGLLAFVLFNRRELAPSFKRRPGAVTALALALIAGLGVLAAGQPSILRRLVSVTDLGQDSMSQRGVLFSNSFALAANHPFLGVGPGNFGIAYPLVQGRGLSPEIPPSRPYVRSGHGHNDFLQMAAETGFPGALLWLALGLWFFSMLWGKLKKADGAGRLRLSGLGAGLLALAVHGLFNFPFLIVPTQMTAWALAAVALRENGDGNQDVKRPPLPAVAALAVAGLAFSFFSLRPLFTDSLWWNGKGLLALEVADQKAPAEALLSKALLLDPSEDQLWRLLARARLDRKDVAGAESALSRAVELDPNDAEARWLLGKVRLDLGKAAEAEAALMPLEPYATNFLAMWEPLAASRFRQKRFEDALATYERALKLKPGDRVLMENQAASLGSLYRFEEALAVLEDVLASHPDSIDAHLSKAITYIKMGKKKEARLSLQAVLKLKPDNEQAKALLTNTK